jgi:hypothetical protein
MQLEKFQKLIALYALDILNESERREVEAAIATSPALQAQLADFQSAVDVIAYSAPSMPVAANLKDRLFERINNQNQAPNLSFVESLKKEAAKVTWKPFAPVPGVSVGKFYTDYQKREVAYFIRAEAGVRFPCHQHARKEEMLVLEGDLTVLEGDLVMNKKTYGIGELVRSAPGSSHQPSSSSGCLLLLRSSFEDAIVAIN